MIGLRTVTKGLDGFAEGLVDETRRDAIAPTERGGEKLVERTQRSLSVRGGPSAPGTPPAMDEGTLRDSIGRTEVHASSGEVTLEWGVGIGPEAEARLTRHAARLGVSVDSLLAKAHLLEFGGIGADGRRYPARPFLRSTETALESEVEAEWRRAFS